ncbi:MAG: cytochrome C [Burkholderiales bacterium]
MRCSRIATRLFAAPVLLLISGLPMPALAQSLESVIMPGKVIEGHAKIEAQCTQCHIPFNKAGQAALCLDCHKEIAADVRAKTGYHGRIPQRECRACHTDHKGRQAKVVVLDERTFDHSQSDFALRGAHTQTACKACHVPGKKHRDAPLACVDCHRKDDKHKGTLGPKCADCHIESKWKEVRFDHDPTRFPLRNKHAAVACRDCHAGERFRDAPRECIACHRKDDTHKGRFGAKCETCHNDRDWKHSTFNHDRDTHFALRGKHGAVRCESCHRAPLYREKLPSACIACHRNDDTHKGNLGPKCESCHNERSWKTSSFNHDTDADFPLRGEHRAARCETCHKDNAFKQKLPKTCIGCHRKDDEEKGHKGRFGEKCQTCHTEKSWAAITFDHGRDTRYLLRGKHAKVKCDSCHRGDLYRDKLPTDCVACHERDDKHNGQLGRSCESCHGETDWKRTSFDHNRSRFPLLGRHAKVECKACHAGPRYRDAKTECVACHAKDDAHKRRLGPRCESCHNARDWKIWDFDHNKTRFRLEGAHIKVECLACHRQPVPDRIRLDAACGGCHLHDDVHNGQFGNQCQRCHQIDNWRAIKPRVGMPG